MRALFAFSIFAATAMLWPAHAAQPMLQQTDLFTHGDAGINTYRIPAMVETADHVIIAVVDARHNSSRDMPAHISLIMRRSRDLGAHWDAPRIIVSAPEDSGVGDTALLYDRMKRRLWCFHSFGPPGIGFWTAKPGAVTGPTTFQIHAVYSDDDGDTWSAPIDITPQLKDPSWPAMFAASGTDIQLSTGRLLLPLVIRDANGIIHSANAYSDDHGTTWHRGSFIGDKTDENHNVELPDGTVLQNMRNGDTHTYLRVIARSRDGGITFGPTTTDPALIDPICNAGITRYHHGHTDAILFSNAASATSKRENLTIKLSEDNGKTWRYAALLSPGPAAYSTIIMLHDGSIGVLYERGEKNYAEHITFARFSLNWIKKNSTLKK